MKQVRRNMMSEAADLDWRLLKDWSHQLIREKLMRMSSFCIITACKSVRPSGGDGFCLFLHNTRLNCASTHVHNNMLSAKSVIPSWSHVAARSHSDSPRISRKQRERNASLLVFIVLPPHCMHTNHVHILEHMGLALVPLEESVWNIIWQNTKKHKQGYKRHLLILTSAFLILWHLVFVNQRSLRKLDSCSWDGP